MMKSQIIGTYSKIPCQFLSVDYVIMVGDECIIVFILSVEVLQLLKCWNVHRVNCFGLSYRRIAC